MARKNVMKVIAAFKACEATPRAKPTGRPGPSAGSDGYRDALWTDGNAIYSYAMKIAERLDDGTIWIEDREKGPSRTTKAHIDGIRWGLKAEPLEQVAEERLTELRKEEREVSVTVGGIRLRATG